MITKRFVLKLTVSKLTNNYWLYAIKLIKDKTRHLEDILHISYKSFLAPFIKRRLITIIGCNWSAFKEDILTMNGLMRHNIFHPLEKM